MEALIVYAFWMAFLCSVCVAGLYTMYTMIFPENNDVDSDDSDADSDDGSFDGDD